MSIYLLATFNVVLCHSLNQSIIGLVLHHSTTVLMAQDNVIATVKKMRVNRSCGPDFVGQIITQVRCCHRKGTITEPFGTWNIKFQHISAHSSKLYVRGKSNYNIYIIRQILLFSAHTVAIFSTSLGDSRLIAKGPAYHQCLLCPKRIVTHCAPLAVMSDFHTTRTFLWSVNQAYICRHKTALFQTKPLVYA